MGTSGVIVLYPAPSEDHPHACGDKTPFRNEFSTVTGSSPRVWGQASQFYNRYGKIRIIPTRVGTRRGDKVKENKLKDHPHACGDKFYSVKNCTVCSGSSPRVWGQVASVLTLKQLFRIIPTRVGTRFPFLLFCRTPEDHPHACGDKSVA